MRWTWGPDCACEENLTLDAEAPTSPCGDDPFFDFTEHLAPEPPYAANSPR